MSDERMSVATMSGGAVVEQFDEAIQRVLENIVDPNTVAKAKRTVTLKVVLHPDEERELCGFAASVQVGMAPAAAINGRAWLAQTRDGVVALEHDPKQRNFIREDEKAEVRPLHAVEGGAE